MKGLFDQTMGEEMVSHIIKTGEAPNKPKYTA
jgi:hypothetical protein